MTPTQLADTASRLGYVEGVLLGISWQVDEPKAGAIAAALKQLRVVQELVHGECRIIAAGAGDCPHNQ